MAISIPDAPTLKDLQRYVHQLEEMHGWLETDLVYNCFLMGEEVGEVFRAIRDYNAAVKKSGDSDSDGVVAARDHAGDELVDVLNYLLALANRLDLDLEQAFRRKNLVNEGRVWE